MSVGYTRYRIGKIDDFQNSYSFIDYQSFGNGHMQTWDACKTSSPHRGYNLPDDAIHVFLNFKKVGVFKTRDEAQAMINKLILDSPVNLCEYKYVME